MTPSTDPGLRLQLERGLEQIDGEREQHLRLAMASMISPLSRDRIGTHSVQPVAMSANTVV